MHPASLDRRFCGNKSTSHELRARRATPERCPRAHSPRQTSEKSIEKTTAVLPAGDVQRAADWAARWAELEKSPLHHGHTAGGRTPPYRPEYSARAKAMCERGATTAELAEAFDVSLKTIQMWQSAYDDFSKACELTPACMERVKRSLYDSAIEMKIVTEKIVESGSQRQVTKTTATTPGNLAAARSFVIDKVVPVEGQLEQLLRQMQESRVRSTYHAPDRTMMTEAQHMALGGGLGGERDWSKETAEEISRCMRLLIEWRKKP